MSHEALKGIIELALKSNPPRGSASGLRPSTMQEIKYLIEGAQQKPLELGDIVSVTDKGMERYSIFTTDMRLIVTQVLSDPYRFGDSSSAGCAQRNDIAIAMTDKDDGEVLEFLVDSRLVKKVGSIYDILNEVDAK